jgi:uncharacterized protein
MMKKRRLSQAELIKNLSDKELLLQLYLSQGLILGLAIISGLFLDRAWFSMIYWDFYQIIVFGLIPALLIIVIDIILMRCLPRKYYDDGGINERIFKGRSLLQILSIVFLVAVSEELLFRGVIHSTFGYIIGSLSFVLVHVRYLRKPALFLSILFVSFLIGYMYELTGNLLVTIVAHFFVDFILALLIKFGWGDGIDNKI